MSGIGGMISSVAEGVQALGKSVGSAIEGDWEEAGKEFARAGLEAAGMAGTALGAGPVAERIQEGIEGVLDETLLEGGTGDVPAPDGGGQSGIDVSSMLSGAAEGLLGGISGGGDALGSVLGALSGGGDTIGGLQELLGGAGGLLEGGVGKEQIADFSTKITDFGEATGLMSQMSADGGKVAGRVVSASV